MYVYVCTINQDIFTYLSLYIRELQENLIRSHAAGVGNPLNPEQVRRFMCLRINVLAKGHSGISLQVLEQFISAFNGMLTQMF